MRDLFPLYSSDGELQDWISAQRMARLDRLGLIRIVRHKKGRASRCILHRRPGDPTPTSPSAYTGRSYSYLERLDSGRRLWALRKLREREGIPLALLALITHESVAEERAQLAHV